MSYSISTTVYGIPLSNNYGERPEWIDDMIMEDSIGGIIEVYSSSSENPAAFGAVMGRFDECCFFHEGAKLMDTLNILKHPDAVQEFRDLWSALDPETQKLIGEFGGQPRVIVL